MRLGILPGSFNPPTQAHLALAESALADADAALDEVLLVLPRVFPHKAYEFANFAQRVEMLRALMHRRPRLSAAASDGALFAEIAQECRAAYGPEVELVFICGRDAAERIVGWDYGKPNAINEMLSSFRLLVACRDGPYRPPRQLAQHIHALTLPGGLDTVSASDVRQRIRDGRAWEHLVPGAIAPLVARIYRPRA